MNKRQKEVISSQLDDEKAVLKSLEKNYSTALADIKRNIKELQSNPLTQSKAYQLDFQKQLEKQLSGIVDNLQGKNFASIADYLNTCYNQGFIGTMYDLQGQGVPIVLPIDQKQMLKAVQKTGDDIKLVNKIGVSTEELKKHVLAEMQRGFATELSYADIARNISSRGQANMNRSMLIARTEGHRVQSEGKMDALYGAKTKGADVVKQWDSTLDSSTREAHRGLDGQLKELDEPFEGGGQKAMYPGGFGDPAQDCNCRCCLLQRARWAVKDNEQFTKWDDLNKELLELNDNNFKKFKTAYKEMVVNNLKINEVTEHLLSSALLNDKKITSMMKNVVKDTYGKIDYIISNDKTALDYRLKSGVSTKRKITNDFTNGKTLVNVQNSTYDCLRYTDLVDSNELVSEYNNVKKALEKNRYKIVRVKNTLGSTNSIYRGLNTVIESPNGYKFELQFHTSESLEIKNKMHPLFEKARLSGTTMNEVNELNQEMLKLSKQLPKIKNIKAIKSFSFI